MVPGYETETEEEVRGCRKEGGEGCKERWKRSGGGEDQKTAYNFTTAAGYFFVERN